MKHPAEDRWLITVGENGWLWGQRYGTTTKYALGIPAVRLNWAIRVLAWIVEDPDAGWGKKEVRLLDVDDETMCQECGRPGVRPEGFATPGGSQKFTCLFCGNSESYP